MRTGGLSKCVPSLVAALLTVPVSPDALGWSGNSDFHLYLQTTGDWSGTFTGADLGLDANTRILYEHNAGCLSEQGPEYVDMEAHLAALRTGIDRYLPPDFDGLAILDYEGYPLSLYNKNYSAIREPRIEAVLRQQPSLSREQALAVADAAYQPAVRRFFLESLDLAKQMRPNAKWGYYSLVAADRNAPATEETRALNDRSTWLWDRVDVICPYSYTGYFELDPEHERIETLMRDKAQEAVRLSRDVESRTGRRPPVYPYVSIRTVYWGLSEYEGSWATAPQVRNFLTAARDGGADGVVLWQSVKNSDPKRRTESEYIDAINTTLAGVLEELEMGSFAGTNNNNRRESRAYRFIIHSGPARIIDRAKAELSPEQQANLPELRNEAARIIARRTEDRSEHVRQRLITAARQVERTVRREGEGGEGGSGGNGGN